MSLKSTLSLRHLLTGKIEENTARNLWFVKNIVEQIMKGEQVWREHTNLLETQTSEESSVVFLEPRKLS